MLQPFQFAELAANYIDVAPETTLSLPDELRIFAHKIWHGFGGLIRRRTVYKI